MRIVAGKHKGLTLYEFDAGNIRPTTDRVRENIFNKLQFLIPGAKILDLFGGTGAVSIEFLSRGADEVIICDNNKDSVNLIKKNFAKAKEVPNLIIADFKDAIEKLNNKKFDIIFLDPPYSSNFGEEAIKLIVQDDIVDKDGLIIYEHLIDTSYVVPEELQKIDEKKYGTIVVSFFRRNNA